MRYLLYISNATKPPNTCDTISGTISLVGILPAEDKTIVRAGLNIPFDIVDVSKIAKANAAPIASGFPVARIT